MKNIAYIVIHGFGGIPKDVETIKKQLIINGIDEKDIYTPLLKGHGVKGKIKIGTRYEEIIEDLKLYIDSNCKNYNKIYVFGYSMGGLISMGLAINTNIDKLILLNAPMHIWNFRNFVWTVYTKSPSQKIYHLKTLLSSFRYNKVRNSLELRRLQSYIRNNLDRIKCDTCIVQSKKDYVAKPQSANEIYDKLGAKVKEIKWYSGLTHYVPNEERVKDIVVDTLNWAR